MRQRSRLLLALIAAICALVLVPVAAGADSQGGDEPLLRSGLVGSTPIALGGPTIGTVPPALAPWVVANGRARVSRDGKLDVRIEGLVLTATGANPIPLVNAKLICNGLVAATTGDADLSPTGDGRIEATVTVPTPCLAPAVLVTISGRNAYIAANG
jgi:hypothetical protein